jgi:hypothetical protein
MNSKSLLLLLAFAALAHCQRILPCASTWTGKSTDLAICTTLTYYPEMSKQCLQSEILGYLQQTYTIDKDDANTCLSVVIQSQDSYGGKETYMYRGPLNAFGLTDCKAYCDGVLESIDWFKKQYDITLTPLYVSCLNQGERLNDEDLTSVAVNGPATTFKCQTNTSYAGTAAEALAKAPAAPVPPEAINLKLTVNTEPDPNSEYKSIPGWYFIGIAVQAVALVGSLGVFIYTIMLYVGLKKSSDVAPDLEMK